MREVVLDTETTGIEHKEGHRIIEIGCVEVIGRRLTGRHYHVYINPQRDIDEGAQAVHGISAEFLADKPLFADIADDFMNFISGARLVIHNAAFDVGFIDSELTRLNRGHGVVADHCSVLDTLAMAREKHPGQRNSLDALCKRYGVDNSQRDLHGALLDAQILADVYLMMTGGQGDLMLADDSESSGGRRRPASLDALIQRAQGLPLAVVHADEGALQAHEQRLAEIEKKAGRLYWQREDA